MVRDDNRKLAFIFPGQGAQYVGMGKDLYENFKSARHIFETADRVLGYGLSEICFEGPYDVLSSTKISQPAILTVSVASISSLRESGFNDKADFLAGLSLGEYSALVVSEAIDFEDAINLVKRRGEFMHEASLENPGKMASILGLSVEAVKEIAKLSETEIANINCPGQVVVSGKIKNMEKLQSLAQDLGAKKVIVLDVSGSFHSTLMTSASLKLKNELQMTNIKTPKTSVVFNVTADVADDTEKIKENLSFQVNHTTYWQKSIEFIFKNGIKHYLEIGPGKVLRGLLKRINQELKVYNVGSLKDIQNINDLPQWSS